MVEDKEKVMNKRSDDILSLSCREIKFHIFFTNSKDKAYPIWIHFPSPNLVYYDLWLRYHNLDQGTQLWEHMFVPMHVGFQEK